MSCPVEYYSLNDNLPGELAELGGEGIAPAACPVGGQDGHLGGSQQAT